MKIDGMTASLFLCVAFAVGAVYGIRSSYNSIFTEWCSQYEMEYSYQELPRIPRPLAAGMNWQNNKKKRLTNFKYVSILQAIY